jgi:hypothetical protein
MSRLDRKSSAAKNAAVSKSKGSVPFSYVSSTETTSVRANNNTVLGKTTFPIANDNELRELKQAS